MSERTYTPLCHREAVLHGRTAICVASLVSVLQGKTHCSAGVFTDDADLHSLAQGYNYTLASISATEFRKLIPLNPLFSKTVNRLLLLLTVVVIYCKCSVHPNKGDYESAAKRTSSDGGHKRREARMGYVGYNYYCTCISQKLLCCVFLCKWLKMVRLQLDVLNGVLSIPF